MSTTIIYNDETIATATNQSKLLKTAGTYMEGDVLVTDSTPTYNTQVKTGINPSTSSQTITPDSGYDALSSVQINAMPSGTAGTPTATKGSVSNHSISVTPSVTNTTGYISGSTKTGTAVTVSASELVSGTKSISANGTGIDVTNYASVNVAVPGESPNLQAKTGIAPSTSSQTITPDSGYDGLSSVQINAMPSGTAGTPTATKGTVSNHSVSVTPSVTNTTGYISGSTKTGTAVTVSASELVSGTKSISANGTGIDVTNYASVDVGVPASGLSNVVTGTFTLTTANSASNITLPYTGSGYPIIVEIYPSEGVYNSSGAFYTTLQRYAACEYHANKNYPAQTPSYTGTSPQDDYSVITRYKNSTSNSYSLTTSTSVDYTFASNTNAAATVQSFIVRLKSATTMSVFCANTSYGFLKNIEYTYYIVYSS